MLVRLINATPFFRGWQGRLPGTLLEIADGVANTLIRRRVATLEPEPKTRNRNRAGNRSNAKH